MAKTFGLEAHMLSPKECLAKHPLINPDGVIGGVFLPSDGQADPANIALALARGARQRGAQIFEGVKVTGITREQGRATGVVTDGGPDRCRVRGQLRRAVGARGRPHGGSQCAASGL